MYCNKLKKLEITFFKQLHYWTQRGQYGLEKDGRIWIYNSLDSWAKQLKVSKSTIQRSIRSLKEQGIIDSEYLSHSKRNRTLFYSINYEILAKSDFSHIVKIKAKIPADEHMVDHMYYIDNNNKINKSYKSPNNFFEKSSKNLEENVSNLEPGVVEKPKNTIVQDMVKVFNSEFSDISVKLDKNLARNLVAAFKLKFEGSLEKWKEFLKLIKTSSYIMGEKFKLTLSWLLKFSTIDRLKLGELGVKIWSIFTNKINDEELQSRVDQQISEIDEDENFKIFRKQIAQKLSNAVYLNWFAKIKFEKQKDITNIIYPSKFVEDTINIRYMSEVQKCIY